MRGVPFLNYLNKNIFNHTQMRIVYNLLYPPPPNTEREREETMLKTANPSILKK